MHDLYEKYLHTKFRVVDVCNRLFSQGLTNKIGTYLVIDIWAECYWVFKIEIISTYLSDFLWCFAALVGKKFIYFSVIINLSGIVILTVIPNDYRT